MRVILQANQEIKGRDWPAGAMVIVDKELGARLIADGIANRIVEPPENRAMEAPRAGVLRFTGHKKVMVYPDGTRRNVEE